jgi:hypothetical protein
MRSTGWAAILGVVLLACGCQTSKPRIATTTEIGALNWADMAGLTQDEMRRRLGVAETGETVASAAKLENGAVVTTLELRDLARTRCGSPSGDQRSDVWMSHGLVSFTFTDGRLSSFEEKGQVRHGTGADTPLRASCHIKGKPSVGDTLNNGQTAGLIVPALLLSPVLLAQKAVTDAAQSERTAAFAQLRLGEAPPGGFDAWAKANGKHASVSQAADGRTEIRVTSRSFGMEFPRFAYLADGKVVELKGGPPGVCVLRPDRSLMCDLPPILR